MGLELFLPGSSGLVDSGFGIYLAIACFLAYLFSGHSGIYLSQRIGTPKVDSTTALPEMSLRIARQLHVANAQTFEQRSDSQPSLPPGAPEESTSPPAGSREVGQLRIFLTPRDRRGKGFRGLFAKPLYQEIIAAAKQHGLMNAIAQRTLFGFSGQTKTKDDNPNASNAGLSLCVELIAAREDLESFCKQQAEILRDHVVIYERLEHWDLGGSDDADDDLEVESTSDEKLAKDNEDDRAV